MEHKLNKNCKCKPRVESFKKTPIQQHISEMIQKRLNGTINSFIDDGGKNNFPLLVKDIESFGESCVTNYLKGLVKIRSKKV